MLTPNELDIIYVVKKLTSLHSTAVVPDMGTFSYSAANRTLSGLGGQCVVKGLTARWMTISRVVASFQLVAFDRPSCDPVSAANTIATMVRTKQKRCNMNTKERYCSPLSL